MPRYERPGLMLRIARDLRAFDTSLDRLDAAAASTLAISRNDLRALELVSRQGWMAAAVLAKHLGLTSGAVTTLIDRMEAKGLLARVADPHDRRRVRIQATAEGIRRERELLGAHRRETAKWLARRPARDLAVIDAFLVEARGAAETARMAIESR